MPLSNIIFYLDRHCVKLMMIIVLLFHCEVQFVFCLLKSKVSSFSFHKLFLSRVGYHLFSIGVSLFSWLVNPIFCGVNTFQWIDGCPERSFFIPQSRPRSPFFIVKVVSSSGRSDQQWIFLTS